jgi:hypothetical protein
MSFDLFLVTFRDGGKATADAAAARNVLEHNSYDHRPEFNAYDINFDDGSRLEMYAKGLDGDEKPFDGAMFAVRGLSNAIGSFIFEFSRAAGCVIFPAMEPACVLLPRADLAAHLPTDSGEKFQRIPITSGAELLAALNGGYDSWRAYRDHVLRVLGGGPTDGT